MNSGLFIIIKTLLSIALVLFLTWLGKTKPTLAGFIVVMPTISVLVIILSHIEFGYNFNAQNFAKGMYIAIPGFMLFYAPFFFINNFYIGLASGFVLTIAYALIMRCFGWI